jgi:hypothetical protein
MVGEGVGDYRDHLVPQVSKEDMELLLDWLSRRGVRQVLNLGGYLHIVFVDDDAVATYVSASTVARDFKSEKGIKIHAMRMVEAAEALLTL